MQFPLLLFEVLDKNAIFLTKKRINESFMKQKGLRLFGTFQTILSAGGSQKLTLINDKTYRKLTLVLSKLSVYSLCTVDCKTLPI